MPVAPVISLTTDFGLAEPFVGLMHARLLAECPLARIVDLSHAVPPFSVEVARFWIERCYRHFPPGSVHLVVVDPGVGTSRSILAVLHAGQVFIAPDNGILAGLARKPGAEARFVDPAFLQRAGLDRPSATFHGRDIFAPLAGLLAAGRYHFHEIGMPARQWHDFPVAMAIVEPGLIVGRVMLIDSFGNCFSNIEGEFLPTSPISEVRFGGHELPLVRTYGDRAPGAAVALVNAFGVLEAACVQGRACERLGLEPGSRVEVRWSRHGA